MHIVFHWNSYEWWLSRSLVIIYLFPVLQSVYMRAGCYHCCHCSELLSMYTSFQAVIVRIFSHKHIIGKLHSWILSHNMLFYAGSFLSKILSACALRDLRAKSLSTAKKKRCGQVTVNKVFQSMAFKQRREDVMSRHSDKLHVLTTFQGQKLWLQVTKSTLWTKSRCMGT